MNEKISILLFILVAFSPVFHQLFLLLRDKENSKFILKKVRKFSIYTFIALIPIIAIFLTLNRINFLNYKSPMPFSEFEKITFEDFKGFEFFKKSLYGNKRFAYIVTSIESEIKGNKVEVQAFFHPSRSFVYNSHTNSKELLKHELYHFKITEIYSRRIKKKIGDLKQIEKKKIKGIIKQEKKLERVYQRKYDFDTYHSYVYQEQKKYEREIDSLLSLYSKYKQSKITINENN